MYPLKTHDCFQKGVGGVLTTPDSVTNPEAPKKMLGSTLIFEAESIEECVHVHNPLLLAF